MKGDHAVLVFLYHDETKDPRNDILAHVVDVVEDYQGIRMRIEPVNDAAREAILNYAIDFEGDPE